jgi:prepilin-type N-terminal cleavage/methylation domain-containing protein
MKSQRRNRPQAFTLLELLVVIAVIGLLAGMIIPVLSKVRYYAKKTQAKDVMYQVETGFKQYLVDYRKFPDLDVTSCDTNALNVLSGATSNSLKYMDVTTNELAQGLMDPWNRIYMLSIDNGRGGDTTAYDRKVTAGDYGVIEKEVAVWSKGEDGLDTTGNQKDDIRSWN